MTVQSAANKTIALGNGVQTQFAFGFVGVAAAYLSVIFTDASGNETVLTQGAGATQYQIVLNAPVPGAIWGLGGTVTYNPSGTPIANGTTLTIFRTLPLTQAISLQNQISLAELGNGAETGLDTLEMQIQQVAEQINRVIVAPIVDPSTINLILPPAAQRANQVLAFDGAGNVIAGSTPATGIISTAMQPVVSAASLAAGRTAFGLGNIAVENIGAGLQDDGAGSVRTASIISQVASNQAIHKANHTNFYAATGALNFTFDRANTLFNGFEITIYALTAAITLIPNAADQFIGLSSGTPLVVPQGSVTIITTDGATSGKFYAEIVRALNPTFATLQASLSTPPATTNTNVIMAGLGSTCKITPVFSTRVHLDFQGTLNNATAGAVMTVQARFGTGTAPLQNAAAVGTTIGSLIQGSISSTAPNPTLPFRAGGLITGLTPGTAYWFDLSYAAPTTGNTTIGQLSCDAFEF